MVLSQDKVHLLLTLQLVFEERADEPGEGFFSHFSQK